jgi:hypothetical protein
MLSLSACGGSSPEKVLSEAQEKMQNVKSMSYNMVVDMNMTINDEDVALTTTCTADYIVDPMTMYLNMAIDMGDLGSVEQAMYALEEDGSYVAYINVYDQWTRTELMDVSALAQYDATSSMDTYLASYSSVKESGTEVINGSKATRYDCVVSGDAIDDVMGTSGVLDQFTALGISEEDALEMLTGLGDMPYTIWIDNSSKLPVRYEMDMSTMMDALMTKMAETLGQDYADISISCVSVSMDISNYDGVDSIEIPAEALAAN